MTCKSIARTRSSARTILIGRGDASVVASHVVAGQESGQLFDRIQRGRQPDSIRPRIAATRHEALEALQRQREMRAALVAGERVELIDDHVANGGELLAELRRGQQDEQRLRRRDENMRRPAEHRGALARGGVAGAKAGADARKIEPRFGADVAHAVQRLLEVQPDVVGERLERRNVEHRDFVAKRALAASSTRPLIAHMKAASVLPLPVGAHSRTSKPGASLAAPITGHPSSCAREGASKRRSNQARTAGWKSSRAVGIDETIITAGRPYKKRC